MAKFDGNDRGKKGEMAARAMGENFINKYDTGGPKHQVNR